MQTLFGKYIRSHKFSHSAVFELKICKGTSLPFDSVKDHQIEALQRATGRGLYHRLTDQPWLEDRPAFTLQKPFDCFYLTGVLAFVVVWFYHPNKPKKFIFIPVSTWLDERDNCGRKSLTELRAREIGTEVLI